MLKTVEEKKRFLASSEMCYDPMYQAGMDQAYHHWMQDKYRNVGWRKSIVNGSAEHKTETNDPH